MTYINRTTVIELEAKVAAMFGMEAGLFSVGNDGEQKNNHKTAHTAWEQLIADKYAHVYHYEGGGASFNSGVSCLLDGNRGMITAEQVAGAINDPEFYLIL
jgi:threonine aldolase